MSLLAGIKIVRKAAEANAPSSNSETSKPSSHSQTSVGASSSAAFGNGTATGASGAVGRMDWMSDSSGLNLLGRPKAPAPVNPETAARRASEAAVKAKRDSEIASGLREPTSGELYGLYDPRKDPGHKAHSGGAGQPTQASAGATAHGQGSDGLASAKHINGPSSGRTESGARQASGPTAASSAAGPAGAGDSSSSTGAGAGAGGPMPAWKKRMLEKGAGGSSAGSVSSGGGSTPPVASPPATAAGATAPGAGPVAPLVPQGTATGPSSQSALPRASSAGAPAAATGASSGPASVAAPVSSSSGPTSGPPPDLNKLAAALLRAQMIGDAARIEALQGQILAANAAGASLPAAVGGGAAGAGAGGPGAGPAHAGVKRGREHDEGEDEGHGHHGHRHGDGQRQHERVVVVSGLDARGMPIASLAGSAVAVPLAREDLRIGRRKGKVTSTGNALGEDGQRDELAYGDREDSNLSIAQLLRKERTVGSGDLDSNVARNILKGGGKYAAALSSNGMGADEEDNGAVDDAGRLVASSDARLTAIEQRKRDLQRAVAAQGQADAALARCAYCLDSAEFQGKHAHKILAVGQYSYVALPPDGPRLPGHVIIVPRDHISCMTEVGEEAYEEVNRFKGALCALYRARDEPEDAVFIETALLSSSSAGGAGAVGGAAGLGGQAARRRHCRIDVVPMDKDLAFDAPLFYRKAIQDSEEWTTNKSLLDTAGKGLRRSVPPGFSYFHVSWQGGGLVHPIEDEGRWPRDFGLDIAAGMLGEGPARFGRREARAARAVDQDDRDVAAWKAEWQASGLDFTSGAAK